VIEEWNYFTNSHRHPVYALTFEKASGVFLNWLISQPQLASTGRQGGDWLPWKASDEADGQDVVGGLALARLRACGGRKGPQAR